MRLQLHALAYNLGNFMRTLAMPKAAEPWSLTSLREKLIKIGAKVVSHGRYVTFQLAEVAVSRQMFAEILSLIARLRAPPSMKALWGRKARTYDGERCVVMTANDRVPAPQGKANHGFSARAAVRGRTLLPQRPEEGQTPATTSGIRGMSAQTVEKLY